MSLRYWVLIGFVAGFLLMFPYIWLWRNTGVDVAAIPPTNPILKALVGGGVGAIVVPLYAWVRGRSGE